MAGYSQQVKLQFMADTSQPQKQLQQLATQLKQISDLQTENLGINQGINQAVKSAETLQRVLQKAVNADTGKLNMNTFVAELNKANTNVTQLSQNLIAAGPAGARAFQGLAASIAQAEMPIKKMNATLQGMLTSLANTVKWQISSSAVHGMMSGFSSAVGYVKDLNRSLNDIRIVTGQSVDDMARFAEQANKAAKALSTTTKAYSDASLIYYQQGDSQEMAAKKAALTIKAANASFGSSTKEMSEYLTAVWNSYQVGADELERYVDIMAALGAKTATSLEEIATSMQKVAATANTVGVSMEQVSSIISTVSSVTRESAESIGTSYKTIFARMGDLKLGKTDDGIGLGQVSSQLKSIGVQVLDATGNLRDMGDIITDLGNKWQTMSAAQKTATAQVVAGKRQYTQLMALFENWDMYNKNMSIATNAEGELQQMADIYAESWEAASARVRASWEGVWDSLLNDEALIKMTNGLADVVSGIESVVDGFGGLPGVIAQVASVVTTVFQTKIASSINGTISNIQNFVSSFQGIAGTKGKIKSFFTESTFQRNTNRSINELQDLNKQQQATYMKQGTYMSDEAIQMRMADSLLLKKQELLRVEKSLSEAQVLAAKESINDLNTQINKVNELIQRKQQQTTDVTTVKRNIVRQYSAAGEFTDADGNVIQRQQALNDLVAQEGTAFNGLNATMDAVMTKYQQLSTASASALSVFDKGRNILDNYNNSLKKGVAPAEASKTAIAQLKTTLDGLWKEFQEGQSSIPEALLKSWQRTFTEMSKAPAGSDAQKMAFQRLIASMQEYSNYAENNMVRAQQTLSQKLGIPISNLQNMDIVIDTLIQTMRELGFEVTKTGEKMTKMKGFGAGGGIGKAVSQLVSGLSSALSSLSSMSSVVANWKDSTLTSKITSIGSVVTNVGMQLASGNWIGAIASGIGAGIGWLIGEMEKAEKEAKELHESLQEELSKKIDTNKTDNDSLQSLIQNFNSLYAQKQQGAQVDAELASAASQLATQYNITGAAVASLTGNYEELIEKLQQIASGQYTTNNLLNPLFDAQTNYQLASMNLSKWGSLFNNDTLTIGQQRYYMTGARGANNNYLSDNAIANINDLQELGYAFAPTLNLDELSTFLRGANYLDDGADQVYQRQISTYNIGGTSGWNETLKDRNQQNSDYTALSLLQEFDTQTGSNLTKQFLSEEGKNLHLLTGGSAQYMYHQYEDLVALVKYMESKGLDTTTGIGKGIKDYLATVEEDMKYYKEALDNYGAAVVTQESMRFTGKNAGEQYSFANFTEDFNKSYQTYLDLLQKQYGTTMDEAELEKMAYKAVTSGVNLNSGLNSYMQALEAAYEITGDLSQAQATLTAIIDTGKIDTKYIDERLLRAYQNEDKSYYNAILNARQQEQAYNDAVAIYQGAENGLSLLKEDMSFEEMGQLYDAFDWGQGDVIAWEQFYAMSYEDKTAYLESLSEQYLTTSQEAAKNARIAAEAEETAAIKARDDYIKMQRPGTNIRAGLLDGANWSQNNGYTIKDASNLTSAQKDYIEMWNAYKAAGGTKQESDWYNSSDYFLTMVDYDAIKDQAYASLKDLFDYDEDTKAYTLRTKNADGTDIQFSEEQQRMLDEYNAWLAMTDTEGRQINAGKNITDFITYKQGEGAGGFSQDVIDEYNRLVAEATVAGEQVDEAFRQEALWKAMGAQVDSVTTKIQKLSKALSQLPTNKEDLQFIANTLFGGNMTRTMNSTAEERALAMLGVLETPELVRSRVTNIRRSGGPQAVDADGNLAEAPILATTYSATSEDYAKYLEDWQNYDTLMSDALAVLNAGNISNIENATSALSALGDEYESFAQTGKLSDTTKNALEMAGIDPNSITDIESYKAAMATLQQQQDSAVASMRTNLEKYGEGIIDWTKAGTDVTFDEFIADQAARQGMSVEALLEQLPGLREAYEQWRQAAIQANDASVDLDAVDAQLRLSQAAAQSASELAKLKTAAEEAKTAVDQLNGALGKTEPLSTETSMRLEQLGLDISSWGDGTGEGALKAYGRVLGHSAMTQIEVLQHQKSKESDIAAVLGRWDAATELGDQRGWSTGLVKMGKDERSKLFDEMGLSAPVVIEIERMVEEAEKAGRELTWSDILQGLQDYDEDLTEQMDIIWAQFEDSGVKAVQAILQAEQTAAQQTVQIWKTACQAILAAKQGIAEGKSIGESLMGSDGQMAAIIAIALGQNKTPEQIKAMLSGGDSQAWQDVVSAGPDFNAATYATAQGGQTQFLYNSSGVMAGSASELYTNASDALGDHWENFLSQLTEAELASYNAAKAKAQTEGVKFDGKQWLLDYLFPGWKNADGTFTSKATDDYNRSRGAVLEGEWTAEMKQARTELDAARTTFNRTYQEETANIKDWQAIHDAAVTSQQTGQSIYDILGKDQAAGIMARLGLTKEQLNAQTVETATAAINASVANINAAKVTFNTTTDGIENIEMLGTAKDDAQEEVGEQVSTTTNTYGNATWVPVKPLKRNGPQAITADGEPAMTLNTTNGYDSVGASITSMAKAYNMSESAMKDYIRAVNNITDENTVLTQAHLDVATAAMRQQAGIDMAAESLDGYIRTIKKGDTDSVGYIKSLEGMRNIYKELYNLTDEEAALLSDDFLTNADNMALLQRAMAGDQTAWTQLQGNYNTAHATQIQAGTLKTQNGALVGDTGAGDDKAFTNQISKIQHEAQLLEQEMEALNSIDITEMPVKGTAAYEALSASLQKAGKSMLEYSRMSQKERAQALGDAKVAKLKEQKVKNAELIKAYEDQYNFENAGYGWDNAVAEGYTTQYQAYLDAKQRELEINQEIADTQQSTEDQINKIGAADVEARIAALEAEKEKVQEAIDAYTELADIMMQAAETGELTASQIQKIKATDEGLLTQWNNATTYAGRVNVAAQAQAKATQKAIEAITAENEGIARAETYLPMLRLSDDTLSPEKALFETSKWANRDAFAAELNNMKGLTAAAQQALLDAYDKVETRMTSSSTIEHFYQAMRTELENMSDMGADEIAELQAEMQTTITQMYADLGEYEVQMANQAVETWLNAFQQIAKARKALIMGEDIGDSLTSSLENYITLAKAFQAGGGIGSLADAFKSGSLTANQLSYGSTGDLSEAIMDSMGLSSDDKGYNFFKQGTNGIEFIEDIATRATELGITRMENETDQAFNDRVNAQTSAFLENLLTQSGYDPTTAATLVQNALAGNADAIRQINEAARQMNNWTTEYTALLATETKIAEEDAEFQATKEKQTEIQEQQQSYADITGKIMAIEGQRTTEGMRQILQEAGITEEEYLAAMREKGYNVTSLDQLVNMDLSGVHDQFVAGAQAAGQIIVDAAAAFMGIVTGEGYGEGSAAYEMAKKYKQEAEASLGLSKQDEKVKAHEAIVTEAQQAGFESLGEQQQIIDLLVQKNELLSTTEMIERGIATTEEEAVEIQRRLANEYKKQTTALKNFVSSGKKWVKVLKDENSTIEDQADALMNLRKNYKNLLGLTDDQAALLGDDFLANAEMMELMEVAAEDAGEKGQEAFNKIQAAAATSMTMVDEATSGLQTYVDQIANLDLEAGSLIPDGGGAEAVTAYWNGVVSAALAGGAGIEAAVAQANAAMEGLGVEMTMQTVYVSATDYEQIGAITGSKYVRKGENGGYFVDDVQVYTEPTGEATMPITLPMANAKGNLISYKKAEAPGGGKSSGGGGGGGGGKPKKVDRKKPEDEKERYHEINQDLERISQLLDGIGKMKERAFGKAHLKNMDQEIAMLKKQQKAYESYYAEAQKYLEKDMAKMVAEGAIFDEYGNINNYDELMNKWIAEYNAVVDAYNAMSAEEQKKADEDEMLKKAEEKLEDRKELMANYEDSVNQVYEQWNNILDIQNQISAANLEKIQYKVEYQVEMNEDDMKLLEYFDKKWEESLDKQDDRLSGYVEQSAKLQDNLNILAEAHKELDAAYAAGDINAADYVEGLRGVRDQILENLEAYEDLKKSISELYTDTLDMIDEKVERQTDHITAASEAMASYITLLGLMGRGKNFRELEQFYQKQTEFNIDNLEALKLEQDFLMRRKQYYEDLMVSGVELNELDQENYEETLTRIDETTEELLSATEEALNTIQESYSNAISAIAKEWSEAMGGVAGSIEGLADSYSYYSEAQGRYVSSAKELYEVSKLNREIEQSIQDTTTTASKQMLQALKERINAQSELNQLTEYDIEMNRLQYELALAKIGLEEAQNAKDTVRLTRDESGNYIYQYTANDDKINEAMQKYEDVLQQINELAANRTAELEQMFIDAQQTYYEKAQEIANDTTLTMEERALKYQEIYAQYCETVGYIQEQYGNVTGHLMESNLTISQHYNDTLTGQAMSAQEGINLTISEMIGDTEMYKEAMKTAIDEMIAADDEHQKKIQEVASVSQLSYTDMIKNLKDYQDEVDEAGRKVANVLGADSKTEGMIDQIQTMTTAWGNMAQTIDDTVVPAMERIIQTINEAIRAMADLENQANQDYTPNVPTPPASTQTPPSNTKPSTPSGTGGSGGTGGNTSKPKPTTVSLNIVSKSTSGTTLSSTVRTGLTPGVSVSPFAFMPSTPMGYKYKGCSPSGNFNLPSSGSATIVYTYESIGGTDHRSNLTSSSPNSRYSVTAYATGGLNTSTGPAWLDGTKDRPELVLNAHDTQNMLSAVGTLRELDTDSIALLVATLNAATSSMFSIMSGNLSASGVYTSNNQSLNQNVEIHADFPNVTDKNEIIDAIDDLVNRASQYAQKKMW